MFSTGSFQHSHSVNSSYLKFVFSAEYKTGLLESKNIVASDTARKQDKGNENGYQITRFGQITSKYFFFTHCEFY